MTSLESLEGGGPVQPIVLSTFGRQASGPGYRWSITFSVFAHVVLIGLTLWLSQRALVRRHDAIAVVLRRPPPPRPPPPAPDATKEAPRKGARGVSLPKAVAKDIQPEYELSFASSDEAPLPTAGKWVGGVGIGDAHGPGWSNGSESGAISRHSLARDPLELDNGWDCDTPAGEAKRRVVVRVRIHVSDSGRPMSVTIIRPGPPAFNVAASECAMRNRFHPALDMHGNVVEGDREVGILFLPPPSSDQAPANAATVPPPQVVLPPPTGPQPDLPVQLDESPPATDKPAN